MHMSLNGNQQDGQNFHSSHEGQHIMHPQPSYTQQPSSYYHHQLQEPLPLDSTLRTVYLGNIPSDISVSTILDHVKAGPIQSIRPLPEKNGLFLTFLDAMAASYFYHEATADPRNRLTIEGNELKVGWGKPSLLPTTLHTAIRNGATRNVYLGLIDDDMTEEQLREDLSRFGHIEHVRIIPEKHIAFVHFLCISNAIKCVSTLQTESKWKAKRINYGRDRCAPIRRSRDNLGFPPYAHSQQHSQQQQHLYMLPSSAIYNASSPSSTYHNNNNNNIHYSPFDAAAAATMMTPSSTGLPPSYLYQPHHQHHPHHASRTNLGYNAYLTDALANRTIYLGNLHPDTTAEDICNSVRGGILSQLRFMPEKHNAFVTFVDPNAALSFLHQVSQHAIIIKNRRIKVGWGKPSALPSDVLQSVVQQGATRNVYIGNINDFDTISEEKLRRDFGEYGEIELVNTLKEKNCAFVNFTSISNAMHAIEAIQRNKEEYQNLRISYGKDRCGNPPKMYNNKPRYRQPDDVVENYMVLGHTRANVTTEDQSQQQLSTLTTHNNDTMTPTDNSSNDCQQ